MELPASFLLLPAGGPDSSSNFEASVAAPIDPSRLDEWVGPDLASEVRNRVTNRLAVWGLRDNTRTLAGSGTKPLVWDRIRVGTLGLFSNHEEYFTRAKVIGTALSDIASEELWGSGSAAHGGTN
jgi:hypothetical protein